MQIQDAQAGQTIRFQRREEPNSPRITVEVEKVDVISARTAIVTGRRITRDRSSHGWRNGWTTTHRTRCFSVRPNQPCEDVTT